MKNYLLLVLAGLTMCSCAKKTEPIETIIVDFSTKSSQPFLENISKITLIPLETNDSLFIGSNNELLIANGEYYVVNQQANDKIFRFSSKGKFLNTIGEKGRGSGEYIGLKNAQILGDTVAIFSQPQMRINFYTKDGVFLSQQKYKENGGTFFYKIGSDYLAYNGYGMPTPERVYLFSAKNDSRINFLETKAKVLNISEGTPSFYAIDNNIYMREIYNDTVYQYNITQKKVRPYLKFDMGKYTIGAKLFQFDDVMKSAEYFMALEYAAIRRYMETENMRFVEIIINKKPLPDMLYGLYLKAENKWVWFSGGKIDSGSLANSFRLLSDNKLYCLMEPYRLKNLTPEEKSKITNPQVLNNLKESDNFVIGVAEF